MLARCKVPVSRLCIRNVVQTYSTWRLVWILIIGMVMLFNAAGAQTPRADERPLTHWVAKLRSGSLLERRDAAQRISEIPPGDTTTVPALVAALEQRQDYDLQTNAAGALTRIGPQAKAAIPALIRALKAPDQEDNSIRQQAAAALAQIAIGSPEALIVSFQAEKNEAVLQGLLHAFAYMKTSDPRVLARIRLILIERGERPDSLKDQAITTLYSMRHPIQPWLLENIRSAKSWGLKKALIEVLGDIQFSLDKKPASAEVIAVLLEAAHDPHHEVAWKAFEGLGKSNVADPEVRRALVRALRNTTANTLVISAAVETAAALFPHDRELAAAVASWLERRDQVVANNMDEALVQFGSVSVPAIVEIVQRSPVSDAKVAGAALLARIGIAAPAAVSALRAQLASSNELVRRASAAALSELGPAALAAIPDLTHGAAIYSGDERHDFLEALGGLATFALAHPDESRPFVRRWREHLSQALAIAKREPVEPDFQADVTAPLERLSLSARRDAQYRVAIVATAIFMPILVLILIGMASWRFRRYLLLLLGRRWHFTVNPCDVVVRILTFGHERRILVGRDASRSAISDHRIAFGAWPPDESQLRPVQQQLGTNERVRLEIDLESFAQPWTSAIAGDWADDRHNVAGQICIAPMPQAGRQTGVRVLTFSALHCGQDDGENGRLAFAQTEAQALATVFRRWGALAVVAERPATAADFLRAFRCSDVLHIASHATFEQLLFADRPITVTDLGGDVLTACRCRLLVLSACDAADIEKPSALLWAFVQAGVNVIAARRAVPDHICRAFFEQMYGALLPTRRAHGIELATAIRVAIEQTRKRLEKVSVNVPAAQDESVNAAVNAFMLFGDPTLNLRLETTRE